MKGGRHELASQVPTLKVGSNQPRKKENRKDLLGRKKLSGSKKEELKDPERS